jgi:hypothetical protein
MTDNATSSRGAEFSIQELAKLSLEGGIRVPEFQRSFRWESRDVLALFDSILRGYPVGSVLLWRKTAPAKRVTLGGLTLNAPKRDDALWVVDGQQRITSLVNAVNVEVGLSDDRFRLVYALEARQFLRLSDARNVLSVPLPLLFDIARLFDWLQEHPEAREYASDMQSVTGRLRDFKLPASVVEQADERVLRDIFDRMNTAGKKLRSSEIFDAIHRASGQTSSDDLSIGAIADRLEASTTFGRIEDAAIYQAVLVRRHPDITRDPHGEFDSERRSVSDFPGEGLDEGYRGAERALERAVLFLTNHAGVPHVTFLAYRFLLLVLARFFALYPDPSARNIELLSRWFWSAAARASELNLNGSTATVRSLSNLIVKNDESGSVQRLLKGVESDSALPSPNTRLFRANQASSRIVLCALWSLAPRDIRSGIPIEPAALAAALDGRDTPNEVAVEIVRRGRLSELHRSSAGNRVVAILDDETRLMDFILESPASDTDMRTKETLASLLIGDLDRQRLLAKDFVGFAVGREDAVLGMVSRFLQARTGAGFEATPPLDSFDFDEDDDDGALEAIEVVDF